MAKSLSPFWQTDRILQMGAPKASQYRLFMSVHPPSRIFITVKHECLLQNGIQSRPYIQGRLHLCYGTDQV